MKKGIRGHDVRAEGLVGIREKMEACGLECIQLVIEKSIPDFKTGSYSPEYAGKIKEMLGDTELTVLGSYINPSAKNAEVLRGEVEKFEEKILFARALGAVAVGTETGFYGESMANCENDSEEAYQHLLTTMRRIVKSAEREGVSVAIEGVAIFVISTPEKMARLLRDLDSDYVKVIFDPVNYLTAENASRQHDIINSAFELFADRIVAIHAKDFVLSQGALLACDPGLGELDWTLILENMKKYGVDAPIIMEGIDEVRATESFARLKGLIK